MSKLSPKPFLPVPTLFDEVGRGSLNPIQGFTLVEMIFVVFFVGLLSGLFLININGARNNIVIVERSAAALVGDIRQAQNLAVAGKTSGGAPVCGFGLRYIGPTSYTIYAGSAPVGTACTSVSRNFDGADSVLLTKNIIEPNVEIKSWITGDLFFESPDPKTFINNSNSNGQTLLITLGFKNTACPTSCKTITVSTSGRIDLP